VRTKCSKVGLGITEVLMPMECHT